MNEYMPPVKRTWLEKFRSAFAGLRLGVREQNSFWVHLPAALLAVAAGMALKVSKVEWCLLLLCITVVLAAELLNTALEHLAKAIDTKINPHLAAGLDVGSAAVLTMSFGAAAVGAIIFISRAIAFLA